MKAYVVGGAVRDSLLGLPAHDRDWVVVGATPEEMVAAGYTPVGRDFPVFLHPVTREEHALARTERKSSPGYHGFVFHAAPDVTLEQDLARRDLTINAVARDPDSDVLIDPFGGVGDIRAGVLRHVSDAFAEDPVRLLRLARFAARWPQFTVAPDTRALLRQLVDSGEIDALVPERVWQEVSRGLQEASPSRMLDVLRDAGALARVAPALDAWLSDAPRRDALMRVLDAAPREPLALRFACLCHGLDNVDGSGTAAGQPQLLALCERWRVDGDSRALAMIVAREWSSLPQATAWRADACLALLERSDALRRPARLALALSAWECLAVVLPVAERDTVHRHCQQLRAALGAAQQVGTDALPAAVRNAGDGLAIGRALREARLHAIDRVLAGA
jgi:tRNA nucleotidyltransferase (CCA-adding enzyme)